MNKALDKVKEDLLSNAVHGDNVSLKGKEAIKKHMELFNLSIELDKNNDRNI